MCLDTGGGEGGGGMATIFYFPTLSLGHQADLRAALSSGMRFSFALESMLRMLNAKDL